MPAKKYLIIIVGTLIVSYTGIVALTGYPLVIDLSSTRQQIDNEKHTKGDIITPFTTINFKKGIWKAWLIVNAGDTIASSTILPNGVWQTNDTNVIRQIAACKLVYTGGDIATTQSQLLLSREGKVIYRTGIVIDGINPGMQDRRYGWLQPVSLDTFINTLKAFKKVYSPVVVLR